ncbi:MAG: pilus assembly protein PilM [Planctomycetota bacterium]
MFRAKFKHTDWPIGLDVGDHSVRLLQLSTRGGSLRAVAAAAEPLREGLQHRGSDYHPAVKAAIAAALSRGGFTGHAVVSALPASAVQCKNLRLPPMPADELAAAVRWEANDRFRLGEGKGVVQHLDAGRVQQGDEHKQELIMLAAELGFVEAHVAALTDNGLRPRAIDSVPTALARIATRWVDDESQAAVVIDLGQSATKVLVVRGGLVRFYKPIDIGLAHLDAAASGVLRLPLTEARDRRLDASSGSLDAQDAARLAEALAPKLGELGREIGLCLRYYGVTFRGPRPGRALAIGGGASAWLAGLLAEPVGIELVVDNPLGHIDFGGVREVVWPGSESAWSVAAGLSMRDHAAASAKPASGAKEAA